MLYLADFKRRYEKELERQPKKLSFKGGHSTNSKNYFAGKKTKKRSTSGWLKEPRSHIKQARELEKNYNYVDYKKQSKVLGHSITPKKEWLDTKYKLRENTGGLNSHPELTPRQKIIDSKVINNRERLEREKDIQRQKQRKFENRRKELITDFWDDPVKPIKTESLSPKQETPKIVKSLPPSKEITVIKSPQISEPKSSTIKRVITVEPTKKMNSRIGRKVLTGLGLTTLGIGALYSLNQLRKTRKDKGKIRGKYRK